MRRGAVLVVALAVLVGGAAACGGDDDGGNGATGTPGAAATAEAGGATDGTSGDPRVDAYCAAVDVYRVAVEAQLADPSDLAAQDEAIAQAEAYQALGHEIDPTTLDAEVAQQFEDCMIRAATG